MPMLKQRQPLVDLLLSVEGVLHLLLHHLQPMPVDVSAEAIQALLRYLTRVLSTMSVTILAWGYTGHIPKLSSRKALEWNGRRKTGMASGR